MKLADSQRLMWQLISAPDGVAPGLRQLNMIERDLEELVRGDQRLSAVQRLDIYANMYFFRLRDILRGDYPAVAACLGETGFHNLITEYLLACPSTNQSVRNVGARLPAFLRTHTVGQERPWLPELAALELARIDVFDGPDAEPLTVEQLRALAPEAFATLPLELIPCHRLLDVQFAVHDVWRQVDAGLADDEEPAAPPPEARGLLVWRQDVAVYHRAVDALECRALARVLEGAPFGLVCELIAAEVPLEDAGPRAFQLLANWASDGLLVSL
jgi:hypothetical protein